MAETTKMVTLTAPNGETWQTSPDTKLSIHEAAKWAGYNTQALRRIDGERRGHGRPRVQVARLGFPHAHRDEQGDRYWLASEISQIIEYRQSMAEVQRKQKSSIYLMVKKSRQAKERV